MATVLASSCTATADHVGGVVRRKARLVGVSAEAGDSAVRTEWK